MNLTVQVAAQSWLAQPVAHLLWALAVRQHRPLEKKYEKLDLAFNNVKPKDWYFVLD